MNHDNITDIATYLRAHSAELGLRIFETYPPLQSMKDPVAPRIATLLRKALPVQALAITGTAKYLRKSKAARIVAECGAGKTYMALGAIHVLAEGQPSATLVMCPSHITHKWAREVLLTVSHARTFLIEDMRNDGDPKRPHGICAVRVKFVTYAGTMQETCLRLMGKKMLVALMMEGKFSGEGLQSLDTDEDLMSAMARELVEKAGVGASADQMWRELERERERVLPQPPSVKVEEDDSPVFGLSATEPNGPSDERTGIHLVDPPTVVTVRKKSLPWSKGTEPAVQLSLFG